MPETSPETPPEAPPKRRSRATMALSGLLLLGFGLFAVWTYCQPTDPCSLKKDGCPPIIPFEKDATLWLTPGQPRPGAVYQVVRDGNVASANLISDYLSDHAPLTPTTPSHDFSVALNDKRAVKASGALLKKLGVKASAEFSRARSISLRASHTEYQAIKSRSAFLTWLQDVFDIKPRHDPDGDNLAAVLRRPLPYTQTEDDPQKGERYLVTEVLRASTIDYSTSEKHVETAALDCGGKAKDCHTVTVGRNLTSEGGSSVSLAEQPIVFWVKMYRVGANPKNGNTLVYDQYRPGPKIVGQ